MAPEGFVVKVEPGDVTIGWHGRSGGTAAMSKQGAETFAKNEAGPGKTVTIESLGDVPYVDKDSESSSEK